MRINFTPIFRLQRLATFAVLLFFGGAFLSQCASIGTPTGGPRDTLPPAVVAVTPELNATNFRGDRIYLAFNEYVQLKDQQKEIYTSPAMRKKPTVSLRGRGVSVELEPDSLDENTTYAIEFGSAVADNNEGNPLSGLRYVFSTGPTIDSLVMSGYTEDSEKADSLGRTFVYFFEADSIETPRDYDSTMFKYKPSKIARSQRNGIFIAQNLKPVRYRIYAYYDSNDNQSYEPSIDKIGFLDSVYNPTQMPDFAIWYDSVRRYPSADPQLYLRMFTDVSFSRQNLQQATRPEQHKIMLHFGAARPQIDSIVIDGVPSDRIIQEPTTIGRDTIALWLNVPSADLPDTLRGSITYLQHDSLRVLRPVTEPLKVSWRLVETREQERERERQEREREKAEAEGREWTPPAQSTKFRIVAPTGKTEVNPEQDLELEFQTPLSHFDSTAVRLLSWSDKKDTLRERLHFIPDSISPRKWRVRSRWLAEREYKLFFPQGSLADIAGEKNDSTTINLSVADIAKFATLKLKVIPRVPTAEYIIQFLNSSNKVERELLHIGEGEHTINYIPAGDMRMRIVEDLNANGKWDSGNLVERRQSERAEFYKNESEEETFTTKTGWEFEFTLDMAHLFAPVTMEQLIERLDKREAARLQKEEERRREEALKKSQEGHNHSSSSGGMGLGGGMSGMGGLGGMMGGGSAGGRQTISSSGMR